MISKLDLKKYESFLSSQQAMINLLSEKKSELDESLSKAESMTKSLVEAQNVMNTVSILVQEESNGVVESLVTHALQSVFGNEYLFKIESRVQRNQPESYLYLIIDDKQYLLKNADDDSSGGVVDVVAFALRIVSWAMEDPRSDNVLILDEPFKNLDGHRSTILGELINELSKTFGLQFIITTRSPWIEDLAETHYSVKKVDKVSIVEKIK